MICMSVPQLRPTVQLIVKKFSVKYPEGALLFQDNDHFFQNGDCCHLLSIHASLTAHHSFNYKFKY